MLRLQIRRDTPQDRHVSRVADILRGGGLAIYPTDTNYGLGCDIHSKRSIDRIYALKGVDKSHRFTFLCSDLAEVARYAYVDNPSYRILRQHLPGKYTFILPASRLVPKVMQSKRRTVGIRIPNEPVCLKLLEDLGHPIVSTTVSRHAQEGTQTFSDPDEMMGSFRRSVDVLLDAGVVAGEASSVIDLCGEEPVVLREGAGDVDWFNS